MIAVLKFIIIKNQHHILFNETGLLLVLGLKTNKESNFVFKGGEDWETGISEGSNPNWSKDAFQKLFSLTFLWHNITY